MATLGLIEYEAAGSEVREVYDDIMATRRTDYVNNFWKALAHDPVTLKRTWESLKQRDEFAAFLERSGDVLGLGGQRRRQWQEVINRVRVAS